MPMMLRIAGYVGSLLGLIIHNLHLTMIMMTVCVYLPAVSFQNHWRFRSAYVRGTGVYLQL